MKYKFILFWVSCFIAFSVAAQQPDYRWAARSGYFASKVVVDTLGNAYTAGIFLGTTDFDPGPGVANLTPTNGYGIFFSKMDALGNLVWAKQISFGSSGSAQIMTGRSVSIDLDNAGNIIVSGAYRGIPDFDPGPNVNNGVGNNQPGDNIFVAKYTDDGDFIWARHVGGDSNSVDGSVFRMITDNSGSIYVYGTYSEQIDFDPGSGVFNLPLVFNPNSGWMPYLWKLDANGNFQWVTNFDGTSTGGYIGGLALTKEPEAGAQSIIVTGQFTGIHDFDPGSGTVMINADSGYQYMAKFTTAGQLVWAGNFEGYWEDVPVATDKNGYIYMCGLYEDSANISPGQDNFHLPYIPSGPGIHHDMYLVKLAANGNVVWAKTFTDDNTDLSGAYPFDIVVDDDDSGSIYISGMYRGEVDFDPNADTSFLTASSSYAFFALKLDSTGGFRWVSDVNATTNNNESVRGLSIALDKYHNVYTSGSYDDAADFDPGPGLHYLSTPPNNNKSGFTYKIGPCPLNVDSITTAVCTSYTLRGRTFDSSGFYTVILPDATGACDSIVVLTLTVQPLDNTITRIGDTLVSNTNLATYQWYKCDGSQLTPIAGATAQQFLPSVNGSYAVAVSYADCQDTSDCFDVPNLGIRSLASQNGVKVVPNPTRDKSSVIFEKPVANAELKLVDAYGRTLWQLRNFSGAKLSLDMKALSSGMYYLSIKQAHYMQVMKVVKL